MKIFGKIDVLILVITLGFLVPMVFYNYDLFHSVAEFFSTLILLGIFIITWHTRDYHKNYYLTSVGIGFFFVGILNLIHVLNYNNLIIHGPYIEQWTIMQYFLAVTIIVPLLPKLKNTAKVNVLVVVYSVATVLIIFCIYFWNFFPKAYDYELKKLLPFKIYSEYVIMAILVGALLLLYRHRNNLEETEYKSSFFGVTLMIFSEFCFTQYGATTEFFNALGHIFRVFTFYMFYKAYIYTCLRQPMDLIFGDLTHTQALLKESMKSLEQKVIDRTSELGETNYVLKQKVEEHKRAEAKFFNLFNTSPLPIIIADVNGKIILSNRASEKVFGYEEKELVGKSLDILIPEHLKVKHSQYVNKYMDMPHSRTMGHIHVFV
ncbi:MAG: PAS domain S-box protein, partial [Cyclobacteriaceae bacterium]|nr:PAS domain S-box protein [Cyclobacteriaceae bacterium]